METGDYVYSFFIALILVALGFGFYKLCRWISYKNGMRPLCRAKDEEDLISVLSQIYASTGFEDLEKVFQEQKNKFRRYRNLLKVARRERYYQISQAVPDTAFEMKETKIRKIWFFALLSSAILPWIFEVFQIFLIRPTEDIVSNSIGLVVYIVFESFFIWLVYHCAYVKKGTRWLSCIIYLSPIIFLFLFLSVTFPINEADLIERKLELMPLYLEFFYFPLELFFWISSFYLRKINYEAKARKQLVALKALYN